MSLSINLVCCTMVLCDEAAQRQSTQKGIALTYAMAMKSYADHADAPDWRKINEAIIARWGMKGLERVKKRAWDILSGKVKP